MMRIASLVVLVCGATAASTNVSASTSYSQSDYNQIICPFLSTMIHENALPVRDWYTRAELSDFVLNAGLSREDANPHITSQFRQIYTNKIDIFKMEGLPDEHYRSSGINDCFSDYSNYQSCPACSQCGHLESVRVCPTPNPDCGVPNAQKFEEFWSFFDADKDASLTRSELTLNVGRFTSSAVDVNSDPGVQGMLPDAFTFLFRVFNGGDAMSKSDLRTINIERSYPSGYSFGRGCDSELVGPGVRLDGSNHSYQFGIRSFRGRWLALGGSKAETSESKHLWTANTYLNGDGKPRAQLRSSDNGFWLSANPDGVLSAAAVNSWYEEWSIEPYTTGTGSKVNIQSTFGGYLTVNYDSGSPGIAQKASRDEEFTLVFCAILQSDGPSFVV